MGKLMKWGGSAFAVFVVIVMIFWFFVVDMMVERAIEKNGTKAVGARVDLDKADLTLFPMGLSLKGLYVTNPDSPMENAVRISTIKMDLEPSPLFQKKIIINEMGVEGLAFNTKRKTSGAIQKPVEKKQPPKTACSSMEMPSFKKPDIRKILENEKLNTIIDSKALEQEVKNAQTQWKKELENLPDEKKLNEYKAAIEDLKKGSGSLGAMLGMATKVNALQQEINQDLSRIKKAQKDFNGQLRGFQAKAKALANAPIKDINRLAKKYALSPEGAANMTRLLFGNSLCGAVDKASGWYEKIKPYIQKTQKAEKDKKAEPKKKGERPVFLIRTLKLNALVEAGNLTGKVENITPDQDIIGLPLRFAFLGRDMKGLNALNLNGNADSVTPANPKNNAVLSLKKLKLNDLILGEAGAVPLSIKTATSDIHLNLSTIGDQLSAKLNANFDAVKFLSSLQKDADPIVTAMVNALSNISRFNLKANITGTFDDFQMTITSDLDKTLKSAVGNLIKKEADQFKKALKQQVMAKVKAPVGQANGSLSGLGGIEKELLNRLNLGNGLLDGLKISF